MGTGLGARQGLQDRGMWWGDASAGLMSPPSGRRFYKDMPHNALEKKSNFEFLE